MSATALATSRAAPPPMPMRLSAPCARKASTPALTWDATGFPPTPEKGAASRPPSEASTSAKSGSAATPLSVTTRGRRSPCASRCSPMRRRAPGPKWMRVGKLKVWTVISGRSYDLEVALQLPVGDRLLGLAPLPLARADEMVHELLPEQLAGQARPPEAIGRLLQRPRQPRRLLGLVRAARHRLLLQLQPLLDAPHARGHRGRHRQVRVEVGPAHPHLQPGRLRAARDDAEGHRPVVDTPRDAGRGPEALDEPLVA